MVNCSNIARDSNAVVWFGLELDCGAMAVKVAQGWAGSGIGDDTKDVRSYLGSKPDRGITEWKDMLTHLHQCLWIISSPLLKPSTFFESAQPCKWRGCSNTTAEVRTRSSQEKNSYRLSMSTQISFERASPCSNKRYSSIQVTKWSLNVPLMSWWRRSGARSSWMSAQGK